MAMTATSSGENNDRLHLLRPRDAARLLGLSYSTLKQLDGFLVHVEISTGGCTITSIITAEVVREMRLLPGETVAVLIEFCRLEGRARRRDR